jgi:uroporphyrinogen decarboxylase
MSYSLFHERNKKDGKTVAPVWFMRQAGRYHDHYQNLKKTYSFMELCKDPKLAYEVTMGPIEAFDFDAAILFSDLLFPLEYMGQDLIYNPGPQLGYQLSTIEDFKKLSMQGEAKDFFKFQHDACIELKKTLPQNKMLLGFVGAPFTLYTYATEGSHAGSLVNSKKGLFDGRFQQYCELLIEPLLDEARTQLDGGADAMCFFDTAVGELTPCDFKQFIAPLMRMLAKQLKQDYPEKKIIYYSRNTHAAHLREIQSDDIDVLGVDWRHEIDQVLNEFGNDYYIQGNFDPCWLHLEWGQVQQKLDAFWEQVQKSKVSLDKWICGLGHGVLQHTPQENVRKTVDYIHQNFTY